MTCLFLNLYFNLKKNYDSIIDMYTRQKNKNKKSFVFRVLSMKIKNKLDPTHRIF